LRWARTLTAGFCSLQNLPIVGVWFEFFASAANWVQFGFGCHIILLSSLLFNSVWDSDVNKTKTTGSKQRHLADLTFK